MLKLALGVMALVGVSTSAQAATIVFQGGNGNLATGSTLVQDFDGVSSGTGYSVLSVTTPGQGARPMFDNGSAPFLAVLGGGSYTQTFSTPTYRANFTLGSLDTGNFVDVVYTDSSIDTLQGAQITGLSNPAVGAEGHQSATSTNGLVSVFATPGKMISSLNFRSNVNSFEVDQISVGGVPEPSTWMMMFVGFGLAGITMRARRRKIVTTMA